MKEKGEYNLDDTDLVTIPSRTPENAQEVHPSEFRYPKKTKSQPTCKICPLFETGMVDVFKTKGHCDANLCQKDTKHEAKKKDFYK